MAVDARDGSLSYLYSASLSIPNPSPPTLKTSPPPRRPRRKNMEDIAKRFAAAVAAAMAPADEEVDDAEPPATPPAGHHPFDFDVCGPRNLPSPNWKDLLLLRSSWNDQHYRRTAMACFVQAAYLIELDRQSNLAAAAAVAGIASKWWEPFKYKLARTLVDPRDSSFYGAVFEWHHAVRPGGAPAAVLALRGTLLGSRTRRRDIQDDLRYVARESLRGSVRFAGALEALTSLAEKHGGGDGEVCVAGHSLGAGFALQVGMAMAEKGVLLECHVFNPPSVSLAASLRAVGERACTAWRRFTGVNGGSGDEAGDPSVCRKWVPNLYVNNSDYVCCFYSTPPRDGGEDDDDAGTANGGGVDSSAAASAAKMFVVTNGPRNFLEAHRLQQWWSDDVELHEAVHRSKLIEKQLRSLYRRPPPASGGAGSPHPA